MILSIETSTNICSVALHNNGILLASQDLFGEQTHAGMITVLIDNILQQTQTSKSQLTAIAVSDGPGSYTGLRIGSSTAKGLCFALDIPLLAVSTLEAMALQVADAFVGMHAKDENKNDENLGQNIPQNILLAPMIDARRMEVYTALYQCKPTYPLDLELVSPIEPLVIDAHSFSNFIATNTILYFGNGAAKCQTTLQNPNFRFIDTILTSARSIGKLAHRNPKKVDIAYYESLYLKEYMAKVAAKKF